MNSKQRNMHFKSAHISAADLSPEDMEMINAYALAPLKPEDIFAFKVSMAANEIDRDHEVFPIETLQKFALLFVGRTVVKDHDHRSDNQIARIYATNLVEDDIMHLTRTNEVYTELIAKCYMVKTSTNADLIAEIQAGIRKEVSLGCRIGKAICSVCGTDNVKRYCEHFPGREYKGETCYFSLEDPTDAYELSFVAIPAQQHAGTVKSYGEKPFYQAELRADDQGKRLMVNQVQEGSSSPITKLSSDANQVQESSTPHSTQVSPDETKVQKGSMHSSTELNSNGETHENEALTWAVDGLAEKLDALSVKLAGVEAAVELLIAKGAGGSNEEPQEPPALSGAEQGEELESRSSADQVQDSSAASSTELNHEKADNQSTANQVQEQVQEGSIPTSTDLNPDEDGSGSIPATALAVGESKEELKAKQAMARLRALELALSIRNNIQNTTTKGAIMHESTHEGTNR